MNIAPIFSAYESPHHHCPLVLCGGYTREFLLGLSKSVFGAGYGSLAVPMMALVISVPHAAAILLPLLFVMDVLGMAA